MNDPNIASSIVRNRLQLAHDQALRDVGTALAKHLKKSTGMDADIIVLPKNTERRIV